MQKKNKQINLRLTELEKNALLMKAQQRGYKNLSEFLLTSIIKPERLNLKRLSGLCYEINKIGVNLNQIARRVHQEKGELKADFLQELVVIDECLNEVLKVAKK
jgi:Bacterial mobilisation protein (MobC)